MAIQPRPEQLAAFVGGAPSEGPILMLNLLKYRDRAEYPDGRQTELSGAQAYGLYAREVSKLIADLGGRIVFAGAAQTQLIGEGELPVLYKIRLGQKNWRIL